MRVDIDNDIYREREREKREERREKKKEREGEVVERTFRELDKKNANIRFDINKKS